MAEAWIDLCGRLVKAYRAGISGTCEAVATMFGVGEATVSRALRRYRETGDVQYKAKGGNNPRRVELRWLGTTLKSIRMRGWLTASKRGESTAARW
jgi:transposase